MLQIIKRQVDRVIDHVGIMQNLREAVIWSNAPPRLVIPRTSGGSLPYLLLDVLRVRNRCTPRKSSRSHRCRANVRTTSEGPCARTPWDLL